MSALSLRAIECLVAVADQGSVSGAARALFLSQPNVSHHLAVLERTAGVVLTRRSPHGLALTPAGRAFVEHARVALAAVDDAVRSARAVDAGRAGRLHVAAVPSLLRFVAEASAEWQLRTGLAVVELEDVAVADTHTRLLESSAVDLLITGGTADERLVSTRLGEDEIVAVVPPDSALAAGSRLRLEDLTAVPIVHYARPNGLGPWLDQAFEKAGVRPVVAIRTTVTVAAAQLAAAGHGVAVTPVSAVDEALLPLARSFAPGWRRELLAVTTDLPDRRTTSFIESIRSRAESRPLTLEARRAAAAPAALPAPAAD